MGYNIFRKISPNKLKIYIYISLTHSFFEVNFQFEYTGVIMLKFILTLARRKKKCFCKLSIDKFSIIFQDLPKVLTITYINKTKLLFWLRNLLV